MSHHRVKGFTSVQSPSHQLQIQQIHTSHELYRHKWVTIESKGSHLFNLQVTNFKYICITNYKDTNKSPSSQSAHQGGVEYLFHYIAGALDPNQPIAKETEGGGGNRKKKCHMLVCSSLYGRRHRFKSTCCVEKKGGRKRGLKRKIGKKNSCAYPFSSVCYGVS